MLDFNDFDKSINEQSKNIHINGHSGSWYVIDSTERAVAYDMGGVSKYFLLEHETHGDEAACLITDEKGTVILDDVWNGFYDLDEARHMLNDSLAALEREGFLVNSVSPDFKMKIEGFNGTVYHFSGIDDLFESELELMDTAEIMQKKVTQAMKAAGYSLDEFENNWQRPTFHYSGETSPLTFNTFQECEEWLDGVVFDDPDVVDAVERIMHPERFGEVKSEDDFELE